MAWTVPRYERQVQLAARPGPRRAIAVDPDASGAGAFDAARDVIGGEALRRIRMANQEVGDRAVAELTDEITQLRFGQPEDGGPALADVRGPAFYDRNKAARERLASRKEQILSGLNASQADMVQRSFLDLELSFDEALLKQEGEVSRGMAAATQKNRQDATLALGLEQVRDPGQVYLKPDGTLEASAWERTLGRALRSASDYADANTELLPVDAALWKQNTHRDLRIEHTSKAFEDILARGDDRLAAAFVDRFGDNLTPAQRKQAVGMARRAVELGGQQRFMGWASQSIPVILGEPDYARAEAEAAGVEYRTPAEVEAARLEAWQGTATDAGLSPELVDEGAEYVRRQTKLEIANLEQQQEQRSVELMEALDGMEGDLTRLQKERGPEWESLSLGQRDAIRARAGGFDAAATEGRMVGLLLQARTDPEGFAALPPSEILGQLPRKEAEQVFKWQEDMRGGEGFLSKLRLVGDALLDVEIEADDPRSRKLFREMNHWMRARGGEDKVTDEQVELRVNELLSKVIDEKMLFEVGPEDLEELDFDDIPDEALAEIEASPEFARRVAAWQASAPPQGDFFANHALLRQKREIATDLYGDQLLRGRLGDQ